MTPARFRDLLLALHWSTRHLAAVLAIKEATVEAWADDAEPIPENVAAWLETLGAVHEEHPCRITGSVHSGELRRQVSCLPGSHRVARDDRSPQPRSAA